METNPLLVPMHELVDYSKVKPEHIAPAIESLLTAAKQSIDQAADPQTAPIWENIIARVDDANEPLWRAWSIAGHLKSVISTPELREAYQSMLGPVTEYATWVGQHEGLYRQYQKLHDSSDFNQWPPARKRVVDLALRNFRLGGVELQGEARERYAKLSEEQAQLSQSFSENVLDATDKWSMTIEDEMKLTGVPQDVKDAAHALANGKGYKLTLQMPCYLPIMQYAEDRDLRHDMYRAYATRASEHGQDPALDNSTLIERSLSLRAEEARLLGFEHFASLRLETRMADSAEEVIDFLRQLSARAKPFAERDLAELKSFAREHLAIEDLQPWDVPYASEQLKQSRYAYSEEEVKQYFTEPRVLDGLFDVVQTLFGVILKPFDFQGWHPDARCVSVHHPDGQLIGHLALDLYARQGKQGGAWVDSERNRRLQGAPLQTPVVYLTCNFSRPQGDRPALLTHDDVITLFHEMGHALHALLSEVDEPGASAFAAVEWDAIELPSQFMENFCWEWPVLQKLTSHVDTGESLPRELYDRMMAARHFQSGMQTVRQIEFALFDILMHSKNQGLSVAEVLTQLDQVREEVAVMRPPSWHRFPHSFTHLFAGGYGAGYYSYKWAEVLSADAFEAFEEAAHRASVSAHEAAIEMGNLHPETGARFRKEILSVGGIRPAADSFEAFRGRKPKIDALLRHSGMVESAVSSDQRQGHVDAG